MPLDPRAKRFLDMTAAGAGHARSRPTPGERRQALVDLMRLACADAMAGPGADGALPGPGGDIRYRVYSPEGMVSGPAPGMVFFHGGGMVAGSLETHDVVVRALAQESGCHVVAIDYRLAPEHPFPAAIDDAIAATRWVSENASALGIDADRLAICGDSAGATLAAIVCQEARLSGPPLRVQGLICPVLDFAEISASRREFAQGYLIDHATLDADLASYLPGDVDRADPRVSPLRSADLSGLSAAIIHTAECDPLRDEGNAYAERLAAAGVTVQHTCHAGMLHNFHAMGTVLPQGREALKQIGRQLRNALA